MPCGTSLSNNAKAAGKAIQLGHASAEDPLAPQALDGTLCLPANP